MGIEWQRSGIDSQEGAAVQKRLPAALLNSRNRGIGRVYKSMRESRRPGAVITGDSWLG